MALPKFWKDSPSFLNENCALLPPSAEQESLKLSVVTYDGKSWIETVGVIANTEFVFTKICY
jgi:hypothetical protein